MASYYQCSVSSFSLSLLILILSARFSQGERSFTIVNECKETIWPGITPGANFTGGGFVLQPGQSAVYTAPMGWNGRIWGRTSCNFGQNGKGTCQTGNCGSKLNCTGPGSPPSTIANFALGQIDYYDVSLVDGFNVPISVKPNNGTGNCSAAGCDGDLRQNCPSELAIKVGDNVVACRSACDAFNTDDYCCRGVFGNPMTCLPTNYSRSFKQVCPAAYSFAYDDPSSIITCSGSDYIVAFCASRNQTVCSYHDKKLVCSNNTSMDSSRGFAEEPYQILWISIFNSLFAFHFLFIFL